VVLFFAVDLFAADFRPVRFAVELFGGRPLRRGAAPVDAL